MNTRAYLEGYMSKQAAGLMGIGRTAMGGAVAADAMHTPAANALDKATNAAFAGTGMQDVAEGAHTLKKLPGATKAAGTAANVAGKAMAAVPGASRAAGAMAKAAPYMGMAGKALGPAALVLNQAQQAFVDPQTGALTGNVGRNLAGNAEKITQEVSANPAKGGMTGLFNPMGTINAAAKTVYDTGSALTNAATASRNGAGSTGGQRMQNLRNNAIARNAQLQKRAYLIGYLSRRP